MYSAKSSVQGTPYKKEVMDRDESISEDEHQINQILKALKQKYFGLDNLLDEKENEKMQIINDLSILNERHQALSKSILRKKQNYEKYDRTLKEAESAFNKITDSTKSLLHIVKSNAEDLSRKQKG